MDESDQKGSKRTLLQKYEIPIEFLDFSYIKTCDDVKMLERIVKILRSGEEGYYPDLTKCAEAKLKELDPNCKVFRVEESALKFDRNQVDGEMKSWISDMKVQDQIVKNIQPVVKPEPPIRKLQKLVDSAPENDTKPSEKIKVTDYAKWDKFDAEAAELKIELDEERQREIVEVKNKKNVEKTKLIEEIGDVEVDCLSDFEKDRLSLKFKEKGNECYKAKEYDEAIKEYTQSLRVKKSAASFNNRALICKTKFLFLKTLLEISFDFFSRFEAQKIHQSNFRCQRMLENGTRKYQSSYPQRPSFCRRKNVF